MRPRLVGAKRRKHFGKREAARQTDGERRHKVLDVVRAAQLRLRHPQDRRVLINDRSALESEIGPVGVSAKGHRARRNFRQRLAGVHNRDVVARLVFENPQLGCAIFGHGRITIEMVGSEVEPDADRRSKRPDGFELKRTYFNGEDIEIAIFERDFTERFADVAASDRALATGVQHLRKQLGGGRFSVRAGDGDDRQAYRTPAELEFAQRLDFSRREIRRQRRERIDARTQDDKIVIRRILVRVATGTDSNAARAQVFDRRFQERLFLGAVEHAHIGAFAAEEKRGGGPAQTRSQHRHVFALVLHLSFSVANPRSAKIAERIQKRTMTVFSFQPLSSK